MMPRNSSPIIVDKKEPMRIYKIKLERVLGVTVTSNAALDCNPTINTIAYPAGCTVVLLNTSFGDQRHIINISRKTIASLAFSACGRYLVTGEYGHQPAVRVWDLQAVESCGGTQAQQVAESVHHKHGVQCVAFSNTNKYVVSIGTQHDMIVNVWDWRNNIKVASNKVSTKVKAVAFSENGNYFVTVGNRFVKFWFLEYNTLHNKETTPLLGRPAILGELRNSYFYGVACGRGECGDSTYAIIKSGLLCEFNNRRLLDKWVELRTTSANCITVGEKLIFVGCADGIVRCFDPRTLRYVTTIPRGHYLGIDISTATYLTHASTNPQDANYPDVVAITYDSINEKLSCIYNDHSVYVWDVADVHGVGKTLSHLYHSACIWGVEVAPPESHMPPGSFITCSSDDTIRVWNLDMTDGDAQQSTQKRRTLSSNNTNRTTNVNDNYRKNIYSNELLKVVYVDKNLTFIKDANTTGNNSSTYDAYDSKHGVRSIKISADGKHLASGDRAGNIRIHDTATLTQLCKIEAHDAEILCLEYTSHEASPSTPSLLASASRDRFIHVFDMDKDYNLVQTLMDHSSSITAVRFMQGSGGVGGGSVGGVGGSNLQMVSCCADKSLVFRSLSTQTDPPQFERYNTAISKTTLFDMVVDASGKHVVTVCMDRNVRVYNVNSGKHTKTFKGSPADDGTLVKVVMDRSGLYLASSCTDKSVCLYDYYTSECMATMCGHSELATGLKFSNDCRRLISTSGDGCIFVWKIPHDMVVTMHARLSQQATKQGKSLSGVDYTRLSSDIEEPYTPSWAYDMRPNKVKREDQEPCDTLPNWVRRHLDADNYKPTIPRQETSRGKWGKFDMRKFIDENGGIYSGKDPDTETESMDSGTDGHKNSNTRKPPVPMRTTSQACDSALGSLKDHESEAHHADIDSDQEQEPYYDGDAQDINSGEFTVKNIDADELRQSTRRSKWNTISNLDITARNGVSAYSSPNSEDDDQASTPSGENTDRNPMSLLFASSESLDKLVNRERYLRSTFDSMNSSALNQFNSLSNTSTAGLNQNSLSAQYDVASASDGGGANRNQLIINATFATKNNPEALKKRQELAKSISDIRKALDNVGSGNSSMKNSRSTHDVSQIPEKEHSTRKLSVRLNDSYNSSLRRSISLSDLIIQAPVVQKRKPGTKPKPPSRHHIPPNANLSQQQKQQQQHIYRSRSTAALTHAASDTSDTETTGGYNSGGGGSAAYQRGMSIGGATTAPASTKGLVGGGGAFYKRLMRPTISSQNKVKPGGAESTVVGKAGRKSGVPGKIGGAGERIRHAQSELSLIRPDGSDDSSSEDNNSRIRSQLRRSKSFNMDDTLTEINSDGPKPLVDAINRLDRYHQCLTATITELCAAGSSVCTQLGRLSTVTSGPKQLPSTSTPIISQHAITSPDGNRAKLLQSIENTALALLMHGGSLLPGQTGAVVMPLVAMARDNNTPDAVVMCYYSDFLLELIEQLKG